MGLTLVGMFVEKKTPAPEPPGINYTVLENNMAILVEKMKLVERIRADLHKVWVNPFVWSVINAEHKENAARIMGHYCGWKSGGSTWVEIYDNQSGKLIAEYSGVSGFSVK